MIKIHYCFHKVYMGCFGISTFWFIQEPKTINNIDINMCL